jgi:hypothetical protein
MTCYRVFLAIDRQELVMLPDLGVDGKRAPPRRANVQ